MRKGPKLAMRMREATNNYNASRRILVRFPVLADAAADVGQRPQAQATLSPGRKYDAARLESAPDLPRRQRARAPAAPSRNRRLSSPLTKRPMRALRPTSQAKHARTALGGGGYRRVRRALANARGDTLIAKTLDRDLGLVARDLANLRATGHVSGALPSFPRCHSGRSRSRQ